MQKVLFFIVICFSFSILTGQEVKIADDLFYNYEYKKAIEYYKKEESLTTERILRFAFCYYKLGQYQEASRIYREVIFLADIDSENYFFYAEALKNSGFYEQAKVFYDKYLEKNPGHFPSLLAKQSMPILDSLNQLNQKYEIANYTGINSGAGDVYATKYKGFDLVVSELVEDSKKNLTIDYADATKNEGIDLAYGNNLRPQVQLCMVLGEQKIPFILEDKKDFHFGAFSIDTTTNKIYFTRTAITESWKRFKETPQIYVGDISIDNQSITNIELLKIADFKEKKYAFAHPFIQGDSILYFTSNLEGGFGGFDIWYSIKKEGKWQIPINAGGTINTPGDEMYPKIYGEEFYYTTDGKIGYGGLDIFKAKITASNVFGKAELLPLPFNSSEDDFGITFKKEILKEGGFLVSNRVGGKGDDDIYSFKLKTVRIQGVVRDKDGNIIEGAIVRLYDDEGNLLAEVVTGKDGKYSFDVEPDKAYEVVATWNGQEARTKVFTGEDWDSSKSVDLDMKLAIANIQGEVLYEGKPSAGALVKIIDENGEEVAQTKTDANGKYTLQAKTGKTYRVIASKKGLADEKTIAVTTEWDENTKVNLNLKPAITSQGVVYASDGKPSPNTEVYLYDENGNLLQTTRTDENGRYQFVLEKDKNYQIVAKKEGFEGVENIFTGKNWNSMEDLDIYLLPYNTIANGIVTKKDDGSPLAGVKVILTDEVTKRKYVVQTDKQGKFQVKLDKNRSYILKLEKDNFYPKTIEMDPNPSLSEITDLNSLYDLTMDFAGYKIDNIYFELSSAKITRESKEQLNILAETLKTRQGTVVYIKSYADCRGSKKLNDRLTEKRSKSVKEYLISRGIDKDRIETKSMGATNFVNNCVRPSACTESEHALNRRSEFEIKEK